VNALRSAVVRAAGAAASMRPPQRTALEVARDRRSPRREAFARHGDGTFVVAPVRLHGEEGIELGDGVIILEESGITVDAAAGARLRIGDGTRLGVGVEIVCTIGITIGARVSSSDYASITDSWALPGHTAGAPPGAPVVIGDGVYLGWGSVVCPGVHVGDGAFVGEGAVVVDDVDPHTVVYGNPARVVRRFDPSTRRWEGPRFP